MSTSQLVKLTYRFDLMQMAIAYEVHSCNLTSSGEVRSSSVRIRQFRDNLFPVIHSQRENFVLLTLGDLHNFRTRF
jgi:hypothetical protein